LVHLETDVEGDCCQGGVHRLGLQLVLEDLL
jgi:hypothetical protein